MQTGNIFFRSRSVDDIFWASTGAERPLDEFLEFLSSVKITIQLTIEKINYMHSVDIIFTILKILLCDIFRISLVMTISEPI